MPEVGRKSIYSTHPGVLMEDASIINLYKQTGRTLEDWIQLVRESGPLTEKERAQWLKTQHHLGTNTAGWIAERAAGKGVHYDPEALVEAMFAGPKAGLRPAYEQLLKLGFKLGKEVTATPCKTIVPLRRRYVFAEIKPATRTRLDLGLALKNTQPVGRLLETGGFAKGNRITHRIPITTLAEVDDEVRRWLKLAYDLAA